MIIERAIKATGEYPVFVRGTCAEEAAWLLGRNRNRYRSRPDIVYAFPLSEGFAAAGITPIKPIPSNYTLTKMRDEVLLTSGIGPASRGPSLFRYGDVDHIDEFSSDLERLGAIIYFNPRIIQLVGYAQDDIGDRLDQLCAARITVSNDFDPQNICFVEPLGPTDHLILRSRSNSDKILTPRFNDFDELAQYLIANINNITYAKGGFTFPE